MKHFWMSRIFVHLMIAGAVVSTGCASMRESMYFSTMEAFGKEKRDIMISRVKDARDGQEDAQEEFKTALEKFSEVVAVADSDLKKKYESLNDSFERCEAQANEVHDRVDKVDSVADALFDEWEEELTQYTNPELRRSSEKKLDETRRKADQLVAAMRKAEEKMEPVLAVFRDQVLFLKHNLNAQAIAGLDGELAQIELKVNDLIKEMEQSISEANAFIGQMEKE